MKTGKAILGVLAGIAAGTVIGVLLAPDKGERLRKKISRKGEDLADLINDKIDDRFDVLVSTIAGKGRKTKGKEQPLNDAEV